MRTRRSIATVAAVLTLGVVGLAGCSSSEVVSTKTLETQINEQLTQSAGQAPDSVTCKDALPAKEGSTVRCQLTAGGSTYGITVTSQGKINGNTVGFGIEVDSAPTN